MRLAARLLAQGTRMLARDWRAGEVRVLAVALVVAVASITSVAFFADRVSRALVRDRALADRTMVLFSPSHDQVAARDLAEWILADAIPVRMQVQLHKQLWGEKPGV